MAVLTDEEGDEDGEKNGEPFAGGGGGGRFLFLPMRTILTTCDNLDCGGCGGDGSNGEMEGGSGGGDREMYLILSLQKDMGVEVLKA